MSSADGACVALLPWYHESMKTTTVAAKQGTLDGSLDGTLRPFNCDARGAFIKRPLLGESEWVTYRNAYNKAFDKAVGK